MIEDIIKEDTAQEDVDLPAEFLADTEDESEVQIYELGFHIVPTVEESKLSGDVDSIKSLIEKSGGTFISEEFPKKINLAYTIVKDIDGHRHKADEAYFGWIKFEIKKDSVLNIKKEMDANKSILRFLIIKTVKESTLIPKSMISSKAETSNNVKLKKAPKIIPTIISTPKYVIKKDKAPVSEEELDKTIEELIVN